MSFLFGLLLIRKTAAAEPPSSPLTKTRSPGRAPERSTALPWGALPTTTMSTRTPFGDSAVSPPASVTPNFSARLIRPRANRPTQDCGKSRVHHEPDVTAREMCYQPDGEKAFRGIQNQRSHADGPTGRPRDIGRAGVSASYFANVPAALYAHQQIAERNRAEHIARYDQQPQLRRAHRHFLVHRDSPPAKV